MLLRDQVTALLREVSASVVMPRWRRLSAQEIACKSAGEIVTIVDGEAEARLHDGLAMLLPGARIVGEEAVEREPALLEGIGHGLVWLVDPLDGTANFAAGQGPFGMMVALVEDGLPLAGWLFDPRSGRLCHAERGMGASRDGVPVRATSSGRKPPLAAMGTHFMTAERRAAVHAHAGPCFALEPVPRCAAESYPRLALGRDDIALFQRILPWDHAAGALFLTEAGGCVTHWNGQPYRVGGAGEGILAAASERLWHEAAGVLLAPTAGLVAWEDCLSC